MRASSLSVDLNAAVGLVSNGNIEIYRRLASFRLWHEIVAQLIRMLSPVLMLVITVALNSNRWRTMNLSWFTTDKCFNIISLTITAAFVYK